MKNNEVRQKDLSRKEAIKKMGYGAFTASTMMFLLNGTVRAGDWDDVNAANGVTPGNVRLKWEVEGAEPGASPDCSNDVSIVVSPGTGSCINGNVSVTFIVSNSGSKKTCYKAPFILAYDKDGSGEIKSGNLPVINGGESESFTWNFTHSPHTPGEEIKVWLLVDQHEGHPGSSQPREEAVVTCVNQTP